MTLSHSVFASYLHLTSGPKLYFLRLPKSNRTKDELILAMEKDDFIPKMKKIRMVLSEYLEWFDRCPISISDDKVVRENNLVKIQCDSDKDDKYTKRIIARIGLLLAHLKGVVPTWGTHGTQGLDYGYATARIEDPTRAAQN